MTKQHLKKEEIGKIINRLRGYSEKQFRFTDNYWKRISSRDIDHDFVVKTFFEFDKINLIEEDILKFGDIGYDLYYEISNNRTLILGVCPKKDLIFIHGIMRYRKWQSAIKKAKKRKF